MNGDNKKAVYSELKKMLPYCLDIFLNFSVFLFLYSTLVFSSPNPQVRGIFEPSLVPREVISLYTNDVSSLSIANQTEYVRAGSLSSVT